MKNIFTNCSNPFFTKLGKKITAFIFPILFSLTAVANVYSPTTLTDPAFTGINNATGVITAGAGIGLISLRSAITGADNLGGTHTINLSTGTYTITGGQITFGNTSQNITFNGNGPANSIIDMTTGPTKDRIFFINPSGTTNSPVITVNGIGFQNGSLTSDTYGGGAICAGGGSAESLTVSNCSFVNNTIPVNAYGGGAICMQVRGNLSIDNSTFTTNTSNDADGGAVFFVIFNSGVGTGFGDLLVTNSTFTGNVVNLPGVTNSNGGALAFTGQAGISSFNININKNTFLSNTADGYGGAITANNSANLSTSLINFNRFAGNVSSTSATTSGMLFVNAAGSVNADNNWWGCNTGPTAAGTCDKAAGVGAPAGGSLIMTKWLQLKTTASPNPICNTAAGLGNTSTVTTGFLSNSASEAIAVADLSTLIGRTVNWGPTTLGSLSAQQATIQASGTATATFTSNGTGGSATVNTQVDNVPAAETTPSRATITVNTLPIVTNPVNSTVCVGGTAIFTSTITGTPAPTITWRIGGVALVNGIQGSGSTVSGQGTNTLTINNVQPGDASTLYNVQASNPCGLAPSADATLFVNQVTGGTVGSDQTICSGGDPAAFTASGETGSGALTYQWEMSTTSCASGFSPTGLPTTATYDPPAGLGVTTYYRRVTTSTLNLIPCTANSNCITVTVTAITVTNPISTAATQLVPFSRSFVASGGTAPYTYTTASTLPAGLSFNASGLLYGTPTVTGSFPITVTATDANGCTGVSAAYNLTISAGTIGVARWVNNVAAPRPAQVVVNCIVYNTVATTYTDIQTAINAAGNGDVVYITDGTYANGSVVANCITGGGLAMNYLIVSGKSNLIITSTTGSYCNSAAVLTGYGFRIATGNNITIQGLELQNVPVNGFYNSNAGTQTSNVTIKNNYVLNTYGHGIKTDDHPSDGVLNRSIWEISGNRFENIGAFNPGGCSLGPVTAVWLAQAGFNFNIINNTIINTRWAGILCVGQGRDNAVASTERATISGNRINQTVDAGIQIGFSAGAFYSSNGATITHNTITNANTSNNVYIGGITILQNNIRGVNINFNDVSASFNGLAANIAGWQNSPDTKTITHNNFYNLTPGSFGVIHAAGGFIPVPNCLCGVGDDLNLYNFRNNYWGTANGPTYITNPGGTGSGLRKDLNVLGAGTYSLNDFLYTPFRSTPVIVNSVVACSSLPVASNTLAITSAVGTNAQTVCINTAITNITYATTGATGATVTGLPAGVTGSWAGNVVTISGAPSTTVGSPFTYTVTLTGGCGALTTTGTITVTPPTNTITFSSAAGTNAQTVCINTAITAITYATTGATGATVTGLPAGVTGSWAANVITINGTPTTTVGSPFSYTVTLTGGCGALTATGTITVLPDNTITLSSAVGTDAQTVCVNNPITNITYNTTGATGATFSGLPAGVTGNWAANVVTISGSPTTVVGSPFSYTVTLTGGCTATITATGSIAVNPANTITLSSGAGTNAQTVVVNNPITNITYATTGATGATFAGLPAGVSGNWAGNVVTISGSPTTVVGSPFTYTVTLTGGCGTVTATGTITVIACGTNSWAGTFSTDWFTPGNWSCGLVPTALIDVIIPTGTPFPCVIGAGTAQVKNLTINTGAILTNNGTLNVNGGGVVTTAGTYKGTGSFTGAVYDNTGGIVSPGLSPGCTSFGAGYTNGSGTELIEIGGITPCTLHDQLQVTGTATLSGTLDVVLFGGFVPSCGESYKIMTSTTLVGTFATINYPVLPAGLSWGIQYNLPNPGDVTLRIIDIQPPVITCPANITVNNTPGTCGAIVNYPAPTVTDNCAGGSLGNALDFDGTNDHVRTNYANYAFNNFTVETWINLPSYSGNVHYVSLYKNAYIVLGDYGAGSISTWADGLNPISIESSLIPTVNTWHHIAFTFDGSRQKIYIDGVLDRDIPTTGTVTLNPATFNSGLNIGSRYTSSSQFVDGKMDGVRIWSVARTQAQIQANMNVELTTAPGLITNYNFNQGVACGNNTGLTTLNDISGNGNNGTLSNFDLTGTLPDPCASNWANNSAAGALSVTSIPASGSVFPVGTTTVNATTTDAAGNTATCSFTVTVVDNQPPVISCPADIVLCGSQSVTFATPTATDNCSAVVTQIAGLPSGSVFPVGTTINTFRAVDPSGNSVTCSFNVIVNPIPNVNAVPNQVVCNGAPTNPVTFSGAVAGTVFNWTNSNPPIGLAASGSGNIASFTAINAGTTPLTATITVTPIYNTNVQLVSQYDPVGFSPSLTPIPPINVAPGYTASSLTQTGYANTFNTDVWPVGQISNSATIVTGQYVQFTLTVPSGTAMDRVEYNKRSYIGAGATAAAIRSSLDGFAANIATIPVNPAGVQNLVFNVSSLSSISGAVTFRIYFWGAPSVSDWCDLNSTAAAGTGLRVYANTVTCTGTPRTFTYTVNPIPTAIATPASQTTCSGVAITTIALTGNVVGTVYNWTRDNPIVTGIANSGSGDISGILTNSTNIPITVTFTITPAYTNAGVTCTGTPITATVIVNPIPTVNAVVNQVVCNGAPTAAITFTGAVSAPPGTVYNWTNTASSIGLAASGAGNIASFTATNATAAPVVATIQVTPSYTNAGTTCNGTPITFTITVNPTPTATATPASQTVCSGLAIATINITGNAVAGVVYNWTRDNAASVTGIAPIGAGTSIAGTLTNTTNTAITVTFTITPTANGCPGAAITATVLVNPTPTAVATPASQTICSASPITPIVITGNGVAGVVYNWTRDNVATVTGIAASGSGNIAGTLTNTTVAPITVTFTITPTANGCPGTPITATVLVNPAASAAVISAVAALPVTLISEGFNVAIPLPAGWAQQNLSTPIGLTNWFQGNNAVFNAQSGPATSYIGTNFNNVAGANTISNWLFTPNITLTNGDVFTFWSRTVDVPSFPDRLEVRMSTNGASVNAGATNVSVGDYTNLLLTINPGLTTGGYPNTWTQYSVTIAGLGAPTSGRLAFRYFVPNGGPSGINSDYMGIDNVVYTTVGGSSTICAGGTANIKVDITGGVSPYTVVYNANPPGGPGGNVTVSGYVSGTNIPVSPAVTTSYTLVSVTGANGCLGAGNSGTATVTVNPIPTVNAVANQVVCNGASTAAVTFTGTVPGTVYTWTNNTASIGLAAGPLTGNIASFTATNAGTAPVVATITVTPTYTNAGVTCTGTAITFTITVNPTPNAVATPAAQTICSGAAITPIALTGTVPGTVFNWTRDNGIVTGIAASGSGTPISGTLTNPTNLPITVTFTITPTYTNAGVTCTGTPITATVLVNPTPTVNAVANQVVCNGAPTTAVVFTGAVTNPPGTVYTWTNNTPSIGLAAGPLTGNIASFTAINTGTAPVTATITVTPSYTNGGVTCTGTPTTFTITVNPTATVIVPANAFVCNGTVQATGTYNFSTTATGGVTTYSWTNNDISIGLGASGSGNSLPMFTATNPTNVPITGTITVTPTFTNGGVSCVGTSNSFSITVNPTPNATATPASQTICSAGTITTIVNTGTVVGTVFNWTRDNNVTATGIAASGVGNISGSLTNTTNGPVLVTFTITPSYTNGGTTCFGTPVTATVLVNPLAVVNPVANQIVCNGDLTAPVVFTSPTTGGAIVYNWTNNTTSIGLAASGTGNIAAFTAINNGTAPVTATITVTPTYTNGGISCVGTPTSFTITVNPTPQVDQPANQVVCNGAPTAPVIFTTPTTGSVRFNWVNNTTSIGLAASGTGNIPSFIATNVTNAPVVATVTVTPIGINTIVPVSASTTMGSGFGTSLVNTINGIGLSAFPSLTATHGGTLPGDSWVSLAPTTSGTVTFNLGGSFNVSGFSFWNQNGGGPGASGSTGIKDVQILSSTDGITFAPVSGAPTVFAQVAGASGLAPEVFNFASVNATHIRFAIANNYGDAQTGFGEVVFSGNECVGPTKTFTITVNPTPTVNPVANQIVCAGSPTAPVNFTGFVPGTVYNWTNNNPNIGLTNSGSGNIPSFIAVNVGTAPDVATIVVTPSYTNAGVTCTGTPISFTITVNPQGQVNQPASQAVCNGAPTAPVNFTSTVPGTVFSWTNNTTSIGLAASGTGNIPSFIGTNATNAPVVATIVVTPSFTNAGVTCTGPSKTFTITVNPTPVVNAVASQVVCNGAPTANINFTSPTTGGTVVYNWTNNTASIGLPASGTGDILSFIATNPTNAPVTANLTVTMSYSNGGVTCTSAPVNFTITVNPTPQVNQPANQVVCAGTPTAPVNFSSPTTGGSIVYNWTNNQPSIGLAGSGTGNIASFIAINATAFPIVATINVTPVYTNAGTTCTGPFKTFTITVNPIPVVAQVTDKFYCNGATTQLISFSGTVGSTYSWTNSNPGIGLAASGTGDILPFVTTNATNGPITGIITVSPVLAGCPGVPMIFTITVNPTPVVNPVVSQVLCNGSLTAIINFTSPTTGPTGALSFAWTNSAPSIGLAANGTGNIAPFVAVNTGLSPVIALITVTPVYNNGGITCTGATQTFTITVNPTPTVNAVANQVLCVGSATAAVNFTGSVFGTIYNWTNSNPGIGLAAAGAGNIASFTTINAGTTPQVATITVTPNFTNGVTCPGTPITFTITVNPIPSVTPVANQVVCAGSTVTQIFAGPVAGTVYNWTNSNTAIGLAASGTGNLNFVSTNATGAPLTATITVTPTYTNAGGSCSGASTTFTITVNPIPTVNAVLPQVLCNGSATAAVNFTGLVAGTVYNWTNTNTSIGLAASGSGNIASFTATNATAVVQVATITVTPTFTNGGTTCTGTAITFTITVNPTPAVNAIANQVVCNGTATAAVTITGPSAPTTYNWSNNNISIGLAASGTNTIPSFVGINTGSTPVTATITITPVFTNGGISCPGPTSSFTITVNPTAVVNQPADQLVCNGSNTAAVVFSGLPPGSTYSWTNSNTSIGLAASGTGNIASFVATNATAVVQTATITVTPSSTGCGGTVVSFTITVNPTPVVNAIANQVVCARSSTAAVTISGPVAGTVYTWTNSNTTIGLGASGTGNIPSFVTINPTNAAITATITVTPTYTNGGVSCTGNPVSFTITVNPLPNIVFNVPPRVCLTDTLVTLKVSPAGGTWSGRGVSGSTFSASAAGVGAHVLSYTVSNALGCTTTSYVTVTVNDCIERHNVFATAIRLYPNPSSGRFNIRFLSDIYTTFKVRVVNDRGQQLGNPVTYSNVRYGDVIPMNLTNLPSATYWLEIYNDNERAHFPFVIVR